MKKYNKISESSNICEIIDRKKDANTTMKTLKATDKIAKQRIKNEIKEQNKLQLTRNQKNSERSDISDRLLYNKLHKK